MLLEIPIGADVIAVFMRVDDQVDVTNLDADAAQTLFENGKVLVRPRIDHYVHVIALDDVTVATAVEPANLENAGMKFRHPGAIVAHIAIILVVPPSRLPDLRKCRTGRQSGRFENSRADWDSSGRCAEYPRADRPLF